jgi:hypothetical protein
MIPHPTELPAVPTRLFSAFLILAACPQLAACSPAKVECSATYATDLVKQLAKKKIDQVSPMLVLVGLSMKNSVVHVETIRTRYADEHRAECAASIRVTGAEIKQMAKPAEASRDNRLGDPAAIIGATAESIVDDFNQEVTYTVEKVDDRDEVYVTLLDYMKND